MRRHIRANYTHNKFIKDKSTSNLSRFENVYKLAVSDFLKNIKYSNPKAYKRFNNVQFALLHTPGDVTDGVQLCNYFPKEGKVKARVIVYRAPIELRAHNSAGIYQIVYNALMRLVA